MTKRKLEMPDVSGKTVDTITLYDDPAYGRELTIRFVDQTELSVTVGVRQYAAVRHFEVTSGRTLYENNEAQL